MNTVEDLSEARAARALGPEPGAWAGRDDSDQRRARRERKRQRLHRLRQAGLGLLGLGVLAAGFFALEPRPVLVDLASVRRAPLVVAIEESGVTRVKDRFVVSAPVAGSLSRLSFEPGDRVQVGDALAEIAPLSSPLLDQRTRAEAEGRLDAARSALGQSKAQVGRAATALAQGEQDLARVRQLAQSGSLSTQALEQAEFLAKIRGDELRSAEFAERIAREELRIAEVTLGRNAAVDARDRHVNVQAPSSGAVLKVYQKSAGVVQAGTPLVEVGDPQELEVVVDLLTTDAVSVSPGTPVTVSGWGGDDLRARVRRVEPGGFTRPSALGVDEQRVNVIATLTEPRERWQALGDGFRVEAKLVVWQADAVLQVPSGALFRRGDGWAVFRAREGRASLVDVKLGHRGESTVEVTAGLAPGEQVVVHPSELLKDGSALKPAP